MLRAVFERWFTPIALVIAVVLAIGLFKAKSDAAAARKRITALEAQVAAQRMEKRGLSAEAQYLDNPRRLESLALRNLGMKVHATGADGAADDPATTPAGTSQ